MATIRTLADADVRDVAALFMRVYPDHGWASETACAAYFREILFDNPWRDSQLPSWVAIEAGVIVACYAVMPRRMILNGRPIRVAVGCQFFADSGKCDGRVWLQLAKACFAGPQDLTLADGANEQSRRMWTAIGGTASQLYSLHWTRPLRPAGYALSRLGERRALPRMLTLAARPVAALADALIARMHPNRFHRNAADVAGQDLDRDAMLADLPDLMKGVALSPDYSGQALHWLLAHAGRKHRHGRLRARSVTNGKHRIGWFLYYVAPGSAAEVLQVAAGSDDFDKVLRSMLVDAWRQGATALRGRLDPCRLQALSDQHCWLRRDGPWTLIHSRNPDVINAFHQGNAYISRLDGEWWMRFLDQ